ncbi:MAG: hypothetical protein CMJ79_13595 [Planctomycetaceae bacterium]|jgi:hypothetical protein|nr:hypothetical protein [Planctomycetaceae bacterium]MBK96726.1 hypothetical protein [Planctomycetaceae bacterium]
MSRKSNRKRGKQKLRPGSTRDANQKRVRSVKREDDAVSEEGRNPDLMQGTETRAAEAVTTLWVLSTLATFASLLGALTFSIINAAMGEPEPTPGAMQMLPQWFIMVGSITGFCGLLANFLTIRLRDQQAPHVVKLLSGMICGLGLAVGLFVK